MDQKLTNQMLDQFDSEKERHTNGEVYYDMRDGKLLVYKNKQLTKVVVNAENQVEVLTVNHSKYIRPLPNAKGKRILERDAKVGDIIVIQGDSKAYPRFIVKRKGDGSLVTMHSGGGTAGSIPPTNQFTNEKYVWVIQNQGHLKMNGAQELFELESRGSGKAISDAIGQALGEIDNG